MTDEYNSWSLWPEIHWMEILSDGHCSGVSTKVTWMSPNTIPNKQWQSRLALQLHHGTHGSRSSTSHPTEEDFVTINCILFDKSDPDKRMPSLIEVPRSLFNGKFWITFHFPFAKILLSFTMWAAFTTPGARRTNRVQPWQPKELTQLKTVTQAGWKESVNDIEDCFDTHNRSLPSWRGLITTILSTWRWLRQLRQSKSIVRDDLANELPEIRRTLCYLVSSEDLLL